MGASKKAALGLAAAAGALLLYRAAAPPRQAAPAPPPAELSAPPAPGLVEAKPDRIGPSNEELHRRMQDESERLGLRPVPPGTPPERPAGEGFLGRRLGEPGTREQAEAHIRQFAAMRRAVEEASGQAPVVPIAGETAPVLAGGEEEGRALVPEAERPRAAAPEREPEGDGWSGSYSGGQLGPLTVKDPREWAELWPRLSRKPLPAVDFSAQQVVGVFLGHRPTGGYRVEIVAVRPAGRSLLVEYREHQPPPGKSPPEGATSPYAMKAVPRSDLPVRFVALP